MGIALNGNIKDLLNGLFVIVKSSQRESYIAIVRQGILIPIIRDFFKTQAFLVLTKKVDQPNVTREDIRCHSIKIRMLCSW